MSRIQDCVAVVMAAGESKRFGEERKLYQTLGGKPLLYHVLDALEQVPLQQVLVIVQPGDDVTTNFPILENPDFATGQSASIRVAMAEELEWDGVFFCPADQPFLNPSIMEDMAKLLEPGRIIVPRYQGRNGSPALFSRTFREELSQLQGEEGGRPIIRRHPDALVYFEVADERMFHDIDTPEDFALAEQWVTNPSPHTKKNCDKVKP